MSNIFLHFLNRELLRSVGKEPPSNYFEPLIKRFLISSSAHLFSNYANIVEGKYIDSQFIRDLIKLDCLRFYAEKQSIEEYWETSAKRYSFDNERYPYKKNGKLPKYASIEPFVLREFSMTKRLRASIEDLNKSHTDKTGLLFYLNEKKEFWKVIKKLANHKGDEAITISLVSSYLPYGKKKDVLSLQNTTGRFLSYSYLEEILEPINADIITGIKGLVYFDQLSKNYPIYDIYLLSIILKACSISTDNLSIYDIIEFRHSDNFHFTADIISGIIKTLYDIKQPKVSAFEFRSYFEECIKFNSKAISKSKDLKLEHFLSKLVSLKYNLEANVSLFKQRLSMYLIMKKILIVTATDKETASLLTNTKAIFESKPESQIKGGHAVYFMGKINNFEVWHGQCEAGSVGPSGAQAVVTSLIDSLDPTYILMPGIAFGLNEGDQKLGDIVVSTHVCTYEKERLGDKLISRADKVPASPTLLSALRMVKQNWKKVNMHFGVIMSGEKLVDNIDFVKKLKDLQPEAIGGEMEGAGLYSAAYRKGKEWILFKSIVDWGYKKDDDHQEKASSLASEVLIEVLKIITTE